MKPREHLWPRDSRKYFLLSIWLPLFSFGGRTSFWHKEFGKWSRAYRFRHLPSMRRTKRYQTYEVHSRYPIALAQHPESWFTEALLQLKYLARCRRRQILMAKLCRMRRSHGKYLNVRRAWAHTKGILNHIFPLVLVCVGVYSPISKTSEEMRVPTLLIPVRWMCESSACLCSEKGECRWHLLLHTRWKRKCRAVVMSIWSPLDPFAVFGPCSAFDGQRSFNAKKKRRCPSVFVVTKIYVSIKRVCVAVRCVHASRPQMPFEYLTSSTEWTRDHWPVNARFECSRFDRRINYNF